MSEGVTSRRAARNMSLLEVLIVSFSLFRPLDCGNSGIAHDPLKVNKCPLNGKVEDLFRILIDARFLSHISASGCNLTGTLKDLSSLRQGSFRLGNSEFKKLA